MILSTLASDKLVTTTNSIMTEVFTGIKPNKILLLGEEKPKTDYSRIKKVLEIFGFNTEISYKEIGIGIENWRSELRNVNVDIADITPGRKYMALSVYLYINANEIRYIYFHDERKGYRIFGYVPFEEINVIELRSGKKVDFEPPKTIKGEDKVELNSISLVALINLYKLLGKEIKLEVESDKRIGNYDGDIVISDKTNIEEFNSLTQGFYEVCLLRSGFLRFKEEEKITELTKNPEAYFIADTNVYINLGKRLKWLIPHNLVPSRSTYAELQFHTNSTQKVDPELFKFYLGSLSYNSIHNYIPKDTLRGSDKKLIDEAINLKSSLPILYLITGDRGLYNSAKSKQILAVYLSEKTWGNGSIGELLDCLRYFARVTIYVDDKPFSEVEKEDILEEKIKVRNLEKEYNYPYMLQLLEGLS